MLNIKTRIFVYGSFDVTPLGASSQTMGLSPQAFSPTHGLTMLHSLVYIKICMNHIKQSNFIRSKFTLKTPKKLNQSFNAFRMSLKKADQNGGAHGKN